MIMHFLIGFLIALGCFALVGAAWFIGGTVTYWMTDDAMLANVVAIIMAICAGWGIYRVNEYY